VFCLGGRGHVLTAHQELLEGLLEREDRDQPAKAEMKGGWCTTAIAFWVALEPLCRCLLPELSSPRVAEAHPELLGRTVRKQWEEGVEVLPARAVGGGARRTSAPPGFSLQRRRCGYPAVMPAIRPTVARGRGGCAA
jgi:hypothetical protein